MKLRYYADAPVGVDHEHTLKLLASIYEEYSIEVEVAQVDPPATTVEPLPGSLDSFPGTVEKGTVEEAWDDFTYNPTLRDGIGGAPSDLYTGPDDVVGNVGVVVDGELVWATQFWGTHHGWGPVDEGKTAIGFLEDVQDRGPAAITERVPVEWDSNDSRDDTEDETGRGNGAGESTPGDDPDWKPTRDEIRELCTEQSFQRGVGYFEEGRVRNLSIAGSEVMATVQGSREYRTKVDLAADGFAPQCSCPYDYAGECKHVVAVLLAVKDRYDDLIADELTSGDVDLGTAVEDADPDDLRAFVTDVLQEYPNLRERFVAAVGESVEKSLADYKRQIDQCFEDATGRRGLIEYDTHVDFSEYYDLASTYCDEGEYGRALTVYRALSEAIRENFGRIDDSSGYYGRELERTIHAYAECLDEAAFDGDTGRDHLDYLIDQSLTADFAFVREYYDEALRDVDTSEADLQHWRDRLEPHLPQHPEPTASEEPGGPVDDGRDLTARSRSRSVSMRSQKILSTYVFVLDELGDRETALSVLNDRPIDSSSLYLQYVDLLVEQGRDDRARRVLDEALEESSRSEDLRRRAAQLYRDHDPDRYRELLERLFVDHEDWDAYDELRTACTDEEWASVRHGIVTTLGRIDPHQLIDLYLHEGKEKKAFSKVLETEDLDALDRYQDDVAGVDPDAYFDAYRDCLEPYLADQTGRNHYRTVIGHLERMAEIDTERDLESFVDRLKEKHSNRPAFLDELEKAGF